MIDVRNVVKTYGSLRVLDDVNLQVESGEFVAIVGPSGAGKTTLLQIIGTLEKPDSGQVIYDGEDVLKISARAKSRFRNKNLGFVFQFHQLLPEFTIEENVAMPLLIAGEKRREALKKAAQTLTDLGLGERLNHKPGQLSGGERQRAAVARAIIANPTLILADEPTGSLDSHNRQEIYDLFARLNRDYGMTIIVVTHDETLASQASRTIRMQDGRVMNNE